MLVGVAMALAAGCSSDRSQTDTRRERRKEAERAAVQRRESVRPDTDTASLVTPVGGDSLIGAARGAGGVATLRTECATCHPAAHEVSIGRGAGPSATCLECHERSHEAVQSFYAGAVRGTSVPPDTMYLARVACTGCHDDTTFAAPAGPPRHASLDRMCTSCHGTRFAGMLARWRGGTEWRLHAVAAYVAQAAADARLRGGASRARLRAAQEAVTLVRVAGALHNVRGADRLFREAVDSVASAYARAGVGAPPRPALGPDPARGTCLGCHYGVESARATVFGETFDHATHVVRSDVACTECHSNATFFIGGRSSGPNADRDVDPRHGKTLLTAASCSNCHHAPTQPLQCEACHTGDERLGQPIRVTMALDLRPEKAPKSRPVEFLHTQHANTTCVSCHATPGVVRTVATCASCHDDHHREQAARCSSCHGTSARMLEAHSRADHVTCAACHQRDMVARLTPNRAFCLSCHAAQADHEPRRECSPCHLQVSPAELKRRMMAVRPAR